MLSEKLTYGPAKRDQVRSWLILLLTTVLALGAVLLDARSKNMPMDHALVIALLFCPFAFLGSLFSYGVSDFNRKNWRNYENRQKRKASLIKTILFFWVSTLVLNIFILFITTNGLILLGMLLLISSLCVVMFFKLKFDECFSKWQIFAMAAPSIVMAWGLIILFVSEYFKASS